MRTPIAPGRRFTAAAVAGAVLLLGACGDGEEAPGPPEEGAPGDEPDDPPDAEDPTEPDADAENDGEDTGEPEDDGTVITEDDDGETITLDAGEEVALRLASDWLWDEPRPDGDAIELATVDHLVDPGYQEWQITAVSSGSVVLEVSGEPNCDDPDDCPARSVELRIEVELSEAAGR